MTNLLRLGLLLVIGSASAAKMRNIVFIAADDLGWNDVGFHNPDMITPNIDKLARQGVILNSSYVQPVCTPSRHSWMTGVYPFKVGLQRTVIFPQEGHCSPLDLTFLPQRLKKLGYSTHIVGKWHLGMCNWNCTPTYRGFDTFLGYYNGAEDYYTKTILNGIDFNDGVKPINDTTYSTYLYAKRAQQIIESNKTKPFFLYLPFQAVHNPIQVPKRFEDMYPHVKTQQRRQYSGMVSAMDEAIGNVTRTLIENDLMDNTLIIFTADNGGWVTQGGNNYPLRGGKVTLFEGGTRGVAFVAGNGLEKSGYTYDGMLHAVDWHPTILAAAGGELSPAEKDNMDGVNQWEAISTGAESKRTEFVYNLDNAIMPPTGHAAIRVGNYKLIDGYPGPFRSWYLPDQANTTDACDSSDESKYYQCLTETEALTPHDTLGEDADHIWAGEGLYDLSVDPNEHNDISRLYPDIVKELRKKLDDYRKSYVRPKPPIPIPAFNPDNYGGHWMPGWC